MKSAPFAVTTVKSCNNAVAAIIRSRVFRRAKLFVRTMRRYISAQSLSKSRIGKSFSIRSNEVRRFRPSGVGAAAPPSSSIRDTIESAGTLAISANRLSANVFPSRSRIAALVSSRHRTSGPPDRPQIVHQLVQGSPGFFRIFLSLGTNNDLAALAFDSHRRSRLDIQLLRKPDSDAVAAHESLGLVHAHDASPYRPYIRWRSTDRNRGVNPAAAR